MMHKGVSPSSALKNFVGEDSAHTRRAEDVQEEWTKPPTEVMVTNKREPMADERAALSPPLWFYRCLLKF